ncbi:MAB_1171c family putative transporter [Saccharomonospora saliphila]|uniref:MAB_1171c family putative transporter n=1 Tax=Saccharomonospora saliphila TaxID=369829 RepID=UPI0003724AFD|nr:MAB_1171c family putative transporter [Saccharomonospora saliphila]
MGTAVMVTAGLVAVTGGTLRLFRARGRLTPATAYLCAAVITAGVSAALSAPAVLAAAARVEPAPNVTRLLVNGVGMVAAWCVQSMLTHLVSAEPARARATVRVQAVVLALTVTAMAALFLSAPTTYRPDFLDAFAHLPGIYGYLLLFATYIGWSLLRLVRLLGRYAGMTGRRWLRLGMRVMQAGAAFGAGWAVHKVLASTAVFLTGSSYPGSAVLASALPGTSVALIAVGVCVPVCAPRVARVALWARRHRQYRGLRGLWLRLSPVIVEVRHTSDRDGSIHERLSTRVVEILDALLVLAAYRDGDGGASGTAPTPEHEAASVAAALARWRAGAPPTRGPAPGPGHTVDDLDGEIAWLRRLDRALRRATAPSDTVRGVR